MKIKIKNPFEKNKMKIDDILFYSIVVGAILLSAGVYFMGSEINRFIGRNLIILGSGILYVSLVIFTFKL